MRMAYAMIILKMLLTGRHSRFGLHPLVTHCNPSFNTKIIQTPIIIYTNILTDKKLILKETKNKAGIYKFVSKNDSSKISIGSCHNLWNRISDLSFFFNH